MAQNGEPNCELSDIPSSDLQPDVDYTRETSSFLYAWDNMNPMCMPGNRRQGTSFKQHYRIFSMCVTKQFSLKILICSDFEYKIIDTWSMYTVNGWPCKKGTFCQENREAGFWSCELEGGEVGSWDYCCRPDHKCGYSHGYSYPW